jgi:hypothetical protein
MDEIIYSKLDSKPVCYCIVCYGIGDQTLCDADPDCEYNQPHPFGPYSTEQDAVSICADIGGIVGSAGTCPC